MKFFTLTLFSSILVLLSACNTIKVPYNKNLYNPNVTISSDIGDRVKLEYIVALYGGGNVRTKLLSADAKDILASYLANYNFNNKVHINIDLLKIIFVEYILKENESTCYLQSTINGKAIKTKIFSKDSGIPEFIFAPVASKCFKRHAQDIYNHLQ